MKKEIKHKILNAATYITLTAGVLGMLFAAGTDDYVTKVKANPDKFKQESPESIKKLTNDSTTAGIISLASLFTTVVLLAVKNRKK